VGLYVLMASLIINLVTVFSTGATHNWVLPFCFSQFYKLDTIWLLIPVILSALNSS
jgi:hypothetical protein